MPHETDALPEPLPALTVHSAFGVGGRVFVHRYGLLVGVSALYAFIMAGVTLTGLLGMLEAAGVNLVSFVAMYVLVPQLFAGMVLVGVSEIREEPARIGDMFRGFRRIGVIAAIQFLRTMIVVGMAMPAIILMGVLVVLGMSNGVGMSVIIAGFSLTAIAVMLILIRFSLAAVVAIDPRMGRMDVFECMRTSWTLTRQTWGKLILISIILGLLMAAGMFLLIIPGVIVVLPLMIGVYAAAYSMLMSCETQVS